MTSISDIISTLWEIIEPLSPIQVVRENEQGVRWTLGRITQQKSGCAMFIIPLIERVDRVDTTSAALAFDPQSITTKDGQSLVMQLGITYHVEAGRAMLLACGDNDTEEVLAVVGRGIAADVIRRYTMDEFMNKKLEIEGKIRDHLNDACEMYGLLCDSTAIMEYSIVLGIKLFN